MLSFRTSIQMRSEIIDWDKRPIILNKLNFKSENNNCVFSSPGKHVDNADFGTISR